MVILPFVAEGLEVAAVFSQSDEQYADAHEERLMTVHNLNHLP